MLSETKGPDLYKHALMNGVFLGVTHVAITTILYVSGAISFMGSFKAVMLLLALYLFFVLSSGIRYRNAAGGELSFGKAFQHGFIVMAIAGLISLIFSLILYHGIDKGLGAKMSEAIISNREEYMRSSGMSESEIVTQVEEMRKTTPENFKQAQMFVNYIGGCFVYAIMVLLTSFIVRRTNQ